MSLLNRVAIITGASSGIGAATAVHFATIGASLVLNGRNEAGLDKTIEQCPSESRDRIIKVIGDVTDNNVLKNIVDEAIKKFGKINILVNNAGVIKYGDVEKMDINDYDYVMNANLRSVILLTQQCLPHLIETKGSIVNVSSVCGTRSFPFVLAYGISKAGLDQFTKSIALELAPKGVRVNSVNPGVIITELQKKGGLSEEQYAAFIENSKKCHALGRPGTDTEVAKTIAFLASDDASFITAELVHVDGGRHAMCPR